MTNIYKLASRLKLTVATSKGELQVSQLWDLGLETRGGTEGLKDIANRLHKQIKNNDGDLFNESKADQALKLKFDIVMDIIETKRTETSEKTKALAKSQEIDRLQELLVVKQQEKLSEMSAEDIQKRIDELKQA